ncbi:hypothetical protein DFP95_12173 [Cohnella lupini]|uniref:Uncharacterized protein n=1 Tax=Cohnella lupini TaxID=1294267 RepID=A0A3D9HZ92_9BACL|nr:hypothetical protein DFP95_12173 [Cohnella lupini]
MSTETVPETGRATTNELRMIRDYIMFPHMLTMAENSQKHLRLTHNILNPYFEQVVILVMDRITKELASIRREFNKRKIKVFDEEMNDGILYYKFSCRGYQDRFGIVRETLRSEISFRFAEYASGVLQRN